MIQRTSLTPTISDDVAKIFQCKYCPYTSHWSKELAKHQRMIHPNYPPHILQKDYSHSNNDIKNEDEDEGLSALFIDPVRAFGEVIDPIQSTNENDYDDVDSQDEQMVIDHDIDDDEEDA